MKEKDYKFIKNKIKDRLAQIGLKEIETLRKSINKNRKEFYNDIIVGAGLTKFVSEISDPLLNRVIKTILNQIKESK